MSPFEEVYASIDPNRCALPVVDLEGKPIARGLRVAYQVQTTTAGLQEGQGKVLALLPNGAVILELDDPMRLMGLEGQVAMEMRTFSFLTSFALDQKGGRFVAASRARSGAENFLKVLA